MVGGMNRYSNNKNRSVLSDNIEIEKLSQIIIDC